MKMINEDISFVLAPFLDRKEHKEKLISSSLTQVGQVN